MLLGKLLFAPPEVAFRIVTSTFSHLPGSRFTSPGVACKSTSKECKHTKKIYLESYGIL